MPAPTPLARARGLGAAHDGLGHWKMQRLTAISNAVLVLSGPPDGIRLNLHDGDRFAAPELTTAAETTLPAELPEG